MNTGLFSNSPFVAFAASGSLTRSISAGCQEIAPVGRANFRSGEPLKEREKN